MSVFLIYSVFIVSLLSSVRTVDRRCSSLEVWSKCEAFCQKTCADPTGSAPCADVCSRGCICSEGLVRNGSGACIEPTQCTATSMNCPGPNQVMGQCQANPCQNTCEEPKRTEICTPYGCVFGCICEEGYVRDSKGVCTLFENCTT